MPKIVFDPSCPRCHGTGNFDSRNGVRCCVRCELEETQLRMKEQAIIAVVGICQRFEHRDGQDILIMAKQRFDDTEVF